MRVAYLVLMIAGLHVGARSLGAQATDPIAQAIEAIDAKDIAQLVQVMAHDSMAGRHTPSLGLERVAWYVVDQLERHGITPGVNFSMANRGFDDPVWIQRYPVPGHRRFDHAKSIMWVQAMMRRHEKAVIGDDGNALWKGASVPFDSAAYPGSPMPTWWIGGLSSKLVTGRHTLQSIRTMDLRDWFVIYAPPSSSDSATRQAVIEAIARASRGVMVLSEEDSATFRRRLRAERQQPYTGLDPYMHPEPLYGPRNWIVYVRPEAVEQALAVANLDVQKLRADTVPIALPLLSVNVHMQLVADTTQGRAPTAPNVVGVLEGYDTALSAEYVLIAAHMDSRGEATASNADDNASGVAGLLELADAFSRPGARPRRSIVFLATSGGAREQWGSRFFVNNPSLGTPIVAAMTLDMIGRGPRDSITVSGLSDFESGSTLRWAAHQHSELGLSLVDGGTSTASTADALVFVLKAIPTLGIYNGVHGGVTSDGEAIDADAIDSAQAARIARLAFYMVQKIANADVRPAWSAEGRRQRSNAMGS